MLFSHNHGVHCYNHGIVARLPFLSLEKKWIYVLAELAGFLIACHMLPVGIDEQGIIVSNFNHLWPRHVSDHQLTSVGLLALGMIHLGWVVIKMRILPLK